MALGAAVLARSDRALASESCPKGMWASNDSCCEPGSEYVKSKAQCLPLRPERRCIEGRLDDCVVAARQLEGRGSIGAGYAAELYKFACDDGHAPACRGLGALTDGGRGVERDAKRARELYEQACAGGDAPACTVLAERMIDVEDKVAGALALFAQACHRGDPYACESLGEQLALRPKESERSALYYERACVGGVGNACHVLLERERASKELTSTRARELLDRGCRALDPESCLELGDAFRGGSIVPQSSARAAVSYRAACESGSAVACLRLGELTAAGDGVERDVDRASELYGRACAGGQKHACAAASSLRGTSAPVNN